jgi:hypothetical protein
MGRFFEFLKHHLQIAFEIMDQAGQVAKETVADYFSFLLWWFKVLSAVWIALFSIAFGAFLAHRDAYPYTVALVAWSAFEAIAMAVISAPLILVGQKIRERFPSIDRMAKAIASVAFWGSLLVAMCLQPGVRQHPETIFRVIGILLLLAIGSFASLVFYPQWFGRRFLSAQLSGILLFTVFSLRFPVVANVIPWLTAHVDVRAGSQFMVTEVTYNAPDEIAFVNAAGDPVLFGVKDGRSQWHLAQTPGYIRTGLQLLPITQQSDRDEIISQVTADMQRRQADAVARESRSRVSQAAEEEARAKQAAARVTQEELTAAVQLAADQEKQAALRKEQIAQAEQAKRDEIEQKRMATVKYLSSHLHQNAFGDDHGAKRVAVALIGGGRIDDQSTESLTTLLKSKGYSASGDLFTTLSVTDGTVSRLCRVDPHEMEKLNLPSLISFLAVGTCSVTSRGPFQEGLVTSRAKLELRIISTTTGSVSERSVLEGIGEGFSQDTSEKRAREDLVSKISNVQLTMFKSSEHVMP